MIPKLVSIVIPSRMEKFLNDTVNDILKKATGPIEIFVVLDGYDIPDSEIIKDPRVKYLKLPYSDIMNKRIGINTAVAQATGEFVMASDAHCMFAPGFDQVLSRDCEDNMIMIPRRYKLDPINWAINKDFAQIDYSFWRWDMLKKLHFFLDYRDTLRRKMRPNTMIDDTLTFQGSCWIMKKSWFDKMGYMRCEGYTPWGQEDVELGMETWTNGGRVVVNKKTWYAHLFKGKTWGRMYTANMTQHKQSRIYTYDYWINKNLDRFEKVIEKFMPIPGWPENWKEELRKEEGKEFSWELAKTVKI